MISILLPTRNRPDNVRRLVASARSTAVGRLELVVYLDEDDPSLDQTVEIIADTPWASVIVGERVVLSECWNRCAEQATFNVMMHCGDDIVFRSEAWDQHVLSAFARYPDRLVFVHGRDGVHDERLATHGFLHRRWVETVGYFVPPLFASDYNDLWLTEVADQLGRRVFLSEVYTEHMHPAVGKGPLDQTHQERLTRHRDEDCDKIWTDTEDLRQRDVEKLRAAMTSFAETEN